MRNRWVKRLFPVLAVLLLAPWPVAYAYDFEGDVTGSDQIYVEIARQEESVTLTAFPNTVGGIADPIDLFYIDTTGSPADAEVTLYLTNAGDLSPHFRYMILQVGIYMQDQDGEWTDLSASGPGAVPEIFLTLMDARATFSLPGLAKYRVAIDSGSYYLTSRAGSEFSPEFYLKID